MPNSLSLSRDCLLISSCSLNSKFAIYIRLFLLFLLLKSSVSSHIYKSNIFNSKIEIKKVSLYAMPNEREWRLRDSGDPENVAQLSAELGIDPVLASLLVTRG